MQQALTPRDLVEELSRVTPASDARAIINRALRITGVPEHRPLRRQELLRVCEALAAEGGLVQRIAELASRRALISD